jgi:hypothetical protein
MSRQGYFLRAAAALAVLAAFSALTGAAIGRHAPPRAGGPRHAARAPAAKAGTGSGGAIAFSAPGYVDYHGIGGEPTTAVDRYPFAGGGYRDITYVCNPLGVGSWSALYLSSDLGQSFRLPYHSPSTGQPTQTGQGGGDCHVAIGQVTHKVFFVDLSGYCATMNVSSDLGESFTADELGCGLNPGAIDDRPWVATDESAPGSAGGNVYVNFNNDTAEAESTISLARSEHDGAPGSFATDSVCNELTNATGATINPGAASTGAADSTPTPCPDPSDSQLYIAGPVVVDTSPSSPYDHHLYIPFVRSYSTSSGGTDYRLYIARSSDEGTLWTRRQVVDLGEHDPGNIFPELTVDQAGNLYFVWSQDQGANSTGTQAIYYTYSTDGGSSWAAPIELTSGDSSVFPWMQAGSRGRVDLVYYQSNNAQNSNTAASATAWNVYFGQSQDALSSSPGFSRVKVSTHPNHYGQVCTSGVGCTGSGNRDLLDFFTVDVDHQGAAEITWADDDNSRQETRDFFARQLSGPSVFAHEKISVPWPVSGASTTDPSGDVYSASGQPVGACAGMDILGTSASRTSSQVSVTLELNAPPTAAEASACAQSAVDGGVWGAEFWAPSSSGNDNFYLAYRDNPLDGSPAVEAGTITSVGSSDAVQSYELAPEEGGTLGGSCFTAAGAPATSGPCTIVLSASLSGLGVGPGALDSLTGLSLYQTGSERQPPALNTEPAYTNQADAAAPFEVP